MASRQWTVVVLPDDNSSPRQFELTRVAVRTAVTCALFVVAVVTALAAVLASGSNASRADERLLTRNRVLEQEVADMAARLGTLESSLATLTKKDEHYRLLAGLDPLGTEVLMAGIGGPDADTLEASPLHHVDPELGRAAFNASTQLNALVRRANVLVSSWSEAERTLTSKHARLGATPSILPTRGYLSSSFSASRMHPLLHRPRPHTGVDIVAAVGTPVMASANGRVVTASTRGDYGLLIEIDHGYGIVTRYAHLSRVAVKPGQVVQRGQNIGAVGTSGLSAGPHLHYEVLVNGRPTNPARYILDGDRVPD